MKKRDVNVSIIKVEVDNLNYIGVLKDNTGIKIRKELFDRYLNDKGKMIGHNYNKDINLLKSDEISIVWSGKESFSPMLKEYYYRKYDAIDLDTDFKDSESEIENMEQRRYNKGVDELLKERGIDNYYL